MRVLDYSVNKQIQRPGISDDLKHKSKGKYFREKPPPTHLKEFSERVPSIWAQSMGEKGFQGTERRRHQ